jgi:O-antigen/teichoic acid export membrane protein
MQIRGRFRFVIQDFVIRIFVLDLIVSSFEVSYFVIRRANKLTTVTSTIPVQIPRLPARFRALADMRGVWSLADQAVLSAGNFLTSWLLLRTQALWYGNYFTLITIIWFLNNLHMAMVTYPISITSAGITDSELRRRVRRALGMTLLLLIPESIAIAFGTAATVNWRLVPWVIVALAVWQLQETLRRALMARLEHRRAILGDVVSYLGQAAAIFLIIHHGTISIEMAFAIIALSSGIGAVIQILQLQLYLPSNTPPIHTALKQARHHLSLGQWILLGNLITLLSVYSIPWFMRYFHGPAGVAMYSAVLLVLNASNPLLASVANLITPVVAKIKAEAEAIGKTGYRESQRAAIKYSIQGALVLYPFFAVLLILPNLALHIFYKHGSPYLQLATPMRIFTFAYALAYLSAMMNSYLCGLGKSRLPFIGQVANAIVTCLITLPLVAKFGLIGAAWGAIFPVTAQVAFGIYFVSKAGERPLTNSLAPTATA